MIEIIESKMVFGPYSDKNVFEIEKSDIHQRAGESISSVEFVLRRAENKILFVEAKSSSPREDTDPKRYYEFINEIIDKFIHSFELYQALGYGRYEMDIEVGSGLRELDWKVAEVKFILVINGHKTEWLVPIREMLIRKMNSFLKIWKANIIVLNEDMAKGRGLISATL